MNTKNAHTYTVYTSSPFTFLLKFTHSFRYSPHTHTCTHKHAHTCTPTHTLFHSCYESLSPPFDARYMFISVGNTLFSSTNSRALNFWNRYKTIIEHMPSQVSDFTQTKNSAVNKTVKRELCCAHLVAGSKTWLATTGSRQWLCNGHCVVSGCLKGCWHKCRQSTCRSVDRTSWCLISGATSS